MYITGKDWHYIGRCRSILGHNNCETTFKIQQRHGARQTLILISLAADPRPLHNKILNKHQVQKMQNTTKRIEFIRYT